jgi:hypothetical protein
MGMWAGAIDRQRLKLREVSAERWPSSQALNGRQLLTAIGCSL